MTRVGLDSRPWSQCVSCGQAPSLRMPPRRQMTGQARQEQRGGEEEVRNYRRSMGRFAYQLVVGSGERELRSLHAFGPSPGRTLPSK